MRLNPGTNKRSHGRWADQRKADCQYPDRGLPDQVASRFQTRSGFGDFIENPGATTYALIGSDNLPSVFVEHERSGAR